PAAGEAVAELVATGRQPEAIAGFVVSRFGEGRLLGEKGAAAVDLDDRVTPDGTAFRTSVAKVVADLVRDDVATPASASHPSRLSYLLHCDGSLGRYLFGALLDAGREFDIHVD